MLVFFCFFTCLGQSSQIAPLLILLWVRFLFNRFTCNKGRKAIKSKSTQKRLCIKGTLCIKGLNCNWMVPCIIIVMKRLAGSSQLIHAEYSQYTQYINLCITFQSSTWFDYSAGTYLFKVNNVNTRTMCEIC